MMDAEPDRYAVIGNPVAHSKSPWIHAEFARQTGQHLRYGTVLAPTDGFQDQVQRFLGEGGKGLNVTLPFKQQAYALAWNHSPRARAAGAVNTLRVDPEGLYGDNTDGVGLVRDLTLNLSVQLRAARVLLIGAGGAARGVLLPLLQELPAQLVLVNRTVAKARALQQEFVTGPASAPSSGDVLRATDYAGLEGQRFDVVINATSAGLGGAVPPLPERVFAADGVAYDMVYGNASQSFLRNVKRLGAARACDGLGMLVEQAAESFWLWRGVRPETGAVLRHLRDLTP
jgi:shikimate dehydrogenase